MSDTAERLLCKWCRGQSPATATTCERCGAPLDVRNLVTDAGWRQAPQIRDLTSVVCGPSTYQLDGTVVPVAEAALEPGDTCFFEHHAMLWKDFSVAMSVKDTPGGMKRILAGMPFVLSVAHGPGRVSFSRDAPGQLIVLPIDPGMEIDVREHAMLVASGGLYYSYEKMQGLKAMLAAGTGMYLDRFVAAAEPGLLILHGYGNVLERTLGEGETIQVEPGGFLYKDSSVAISITTIPLGSGSAVKNVASRGLSAIKAARQLTKGGDGFAGILSGGGLQAASGVLTGPGITLMNMSGPGRVGIQSMYQHHETA